MSFFLAKIWNVIRILSQGHFFRCSIFKQDIDDIFFENFDVDT